MLETVGRAGAFPAIDTTVVAAQRHQRCGKLLLQQTAHGELGEVLRCVLENFLTQILDMDYVRILAGWTSVSRMRYSC